METTKGPQMDWAPNNGLPNRYKLSKQICIMLFDTVYTK